jgi:hypothetical protein
MASLARARVDTTDRGYATATDFCRIFRDEMSSMYLLALVLTADHEKAEECFVAGLEDSIESNPVFKDWADSWARRNIIKNAIRTVFSMGADDQRVTHEPLRDMDPVIGTITRLAPIERFVFVMTVLERYADRDCAALLNCTRKDVAGLRVRAMVAISRGRDGYPTPLGLPPRPEAGPAHISRSNAWGNANAAD